MADNVVKVNIVADSTQLEKTVGGLKKKLAEALDVNGFSLAEINPWKLAADGIRAAVTHVVKSFAELNGAMAKNGSAAVALGKDLGVTTLEAGRLQEAARLAGVSASEYAEALDKIKTGTTSLAEQAEAWERVAHASSSVTRGNAVLSAIAEMNTPGIDDNLNWIQRAWLKGTRSQQARVGARMMQEVEEGRTERFTRQDVIKLGGSGLGSQYQAQLVEALNKMIDQRNAAKAEADRRREAERLKAEAEAAKEAERLRAEAAKERDAAQRQRDAEQKARRQQENNTAKSVFDLWEKYGGAQRRGGSATDLREVLKGAFWMDDAQLDEALRRGRTLASTPQAIAERRLAAERERQAEAEAERTRLTEREADLQKRIRETEGELSASWMTSAGGSLIGGGSFALAMAERMRAIDREEKQQEMVEELRGVREELRKIVRNTNE